MNLQERSIKQLKECLGNPTLSEIANKTQIQVTRVFRILHGSPMKLSEYEKILKVVNEKYEIDPEVNQELYKLLIEATKCLSPRELKHFLEIFNRKIHTALILGRT